MIHSVFLQHGLASPPKSFFTPSIMGLNTMFLLHSHVFVLIKSSTPENTEYFSKLPIGFLIPSVTKKNHEKEVWFLS